MAQGIKKLSRIQFGKESSAGTAVTATTRWRGEGDMLDDQRKIEQIQELIGLINGADRTAITELTSMVSLKPTPVTPEQFQYLVVMGAGGSATGTQDGVGTDYIYSTNLPTTASPTPVPYTIEGGDNFEAEKMEYTVCTKLSVSGAMGQTAKMAATLMGRQVARLGAFTAASIPAIPTEIVTNAGKVYLDAIGGSYGGTQVSSLVIGFKIDYVFKWIPQLTMDGNLYFTVPIYTDTAITGEVTYLHNTGADGNTGLMASFRAQTPLLLRIDLIGAAVGTPGTTYSTKHVIMDLPIKLTNPGPLGDAAGNNTRSFKFVSRYNTTAGNAGKFVVVNELSALT